MLYYATELQVRKSYLWSVIWMNNYMSSQFLISERKLKLFSIKMKSKGVVHSSSSQHSDLILESKSLRKSSLFLPDHSNGRTAWPDLISVCPTQNDRWVCLAVQSTSNKWWDSQHLRDYIAEGCSCRSHICSEGIKLANLQVIDRKVCSRIQKLNHSEAKTQTTSCKDWS